MHTHFWKLNAFLNPEMLRLGQKGRIPVLLLCFFISLEAELTQEDLGKRQEALSDDQPRDPSQCPWKIQGWD